MTIKYKQALKQMRKKGLSNFQKICIVLLWMTLCIMLFTIPNEKSMGENIFYALISGVILLIGISAGKNNRRK